jgi:hypothetical protein
MRKIKGHLFVISGKVNEIAGSRTRISNSTNIRVHFRTRLLSSCVQHRSLKSIFLRAIPLSFYRLSLSSNTQIPILLTAIPGWSHVHHVVATYIPSSINITCIPSQITFLLWTKNVFKFFLFTWFPFGPNVFNICNFSPSLVEERNWQLNE